MASADMSGLSAVVTLNGVRTDDGFLSRQFTLGPSNSSILIGRSSSTKRTADRGEPHLANAFFSCPIVSRRHARLSFVNGRIDIDDLGSMHGTYVNGIKLVRGQPDTIQSGDIVALGNTMLTGPQKLFAVIFQVSVNVHRRSLIDLSSPEPEPVQNRIPNIEDFNQLATRERATFSVPSSASPASSEFSDQSDHEDSEEEADPDTSSDILEQRSKHEGSVAVDEENVAPETNDHDLDPAQSDAEQPAEDGGEYCSSPDKSKRADSASAADDFADEVQGSARVPSPSYPFSPDDIRSAPCAVSDAGPLLHHAPPMLPQSVQATPYSIFNGTGSAPFPFTYRHDDETPLRMNEYHPLYPVHGLNPAPVPQTDLRMTQGLGSCLGLGDDNLMDDIMNATKHRPKTGPLNPRELLKKPHDPMAIDSIVSKTPEVTENNRELKRKHADESNDDGFASAAPENVRSADGVAETTEPESLQAASTSANEPPAKKAKLLSTASTLSNAVQKRSTVRSKAASVKPFAVGALTGGLAMLGALIFLPDSVFF